MTMNLLSVLTFFGLLSIIYCRGLQEEFTWTRIDYEWSDSTRTRYTKSISEPQSKSSIDKISFVDSDNYDRRSSTTRRPKPTRGRSTTTARPDNNAEYIYQNNIPMGANVWNNKLFITVPRRRPGVPSTLNYVWLNSTNRHNLPLIPYPDWDTNTLDRRNSDRFVSIYRVGIDSCDRMWFVDTGLIETPGNQEQIRPSTLIIMDLKTDRVIRRHVFNSSLLRTNTNLASVTIDITNGRCDDAFAYIPDLGGYGLIVYSLREDRAWRLTHNYFFLEPLAGDISIGGFNFQWNDGIFSIAISDVKNDGFRDAYFHSMAGINQYKVSTRILKNETLATRSYHGRDFEFLGERGSKSQTSSSALHQPSGVLFLGLVQQNALACWNINTPITDMSIVHKHDQKMIYPTDVKIAGDNIVVLTNTMPVFLYGNLDYDETNFRVWVETVDTAIKGTKCEKSRRKGSY